MRSVPDIIEAWARRECALSGIDPDADWRHSPDGGATLEVAVPPEDRPNWRHHFANKAERLLSNLQQGGFDVKPS